MNMANVVKPNVSLKKRSKLLQGQRTMYPFVALELRTSYSLGTHLMHQVKTIKRVY